MTDEDNDTTDLDHVIESIFNKDEDEHIITDEQEDDIGR
jgi:hypothetical protein